jgi:ribosomal protein L12E/L44/L45/RPP1/RPP2
LNVRVVRITLTEKHVGTGKGEKRKLGNVTMIEEKDLEDALAASEGADASAASEEADASAASEDADASAASEEADASAASEEADASAAGGIDLTRRIVFMIHNRI